MGITRAHGQNSMKTPLGEPGAVKNSEICRTLPSETKVLRPNLLNHGELHHHTTLPPHGCQTGSFRCLAWWISNPTPICDQVVFPTKSELPHALSWKGMLIAPVLQCWSNSIGCSSQNSPNLGIFISIRPWDFLLRRSYLLKIFTTDFGGFSWKLEASTQSNPIVPGVQVEILLPREALGKVGGSLVKFPSGIRFGIFPSIMWNPTSWESTI